MRFACLRKTCRVEKTVEEVKKSDTGEEMKVSKIIKTPLIFEVPNDKCKISEKEVTTKKGKIRKIRIFESVCPNCHQPVKGFATIKKEA